MRVEWDPAKNLANQRKHGVSFEEAAALFTSGRDDLEILDAPHSAQEDRFIAIGLVRRRVDLLSDDHHNDVAVSGKLTAFVHIVDTLEKKKGSGLAAVQADLLRLSADAIQATLGSK